MNSVLPLQQLHACISSSQSSIHFSAQQTFSVKTAASFAFHDQQGSLWLLARQERAQTQATFKLSAACALAAS